MERDADQKRLRRVRRVVSPIQWEEFAAAAAAMSWVTYLGTSDRSGRPHVSVVAPGFTGFGVVRDPS